MKKKLVHQTWKQAHFLVLDTTHHQRTSRPDRFELSDLCTNKNNGKRGPFSTDQETDIKNYVFPNKDRKIVSQFSHSKVVFRKICRKFEELMEFYKEFLILLKLL